MFREIFFTATKLKIHIVPTVRPVRLQYKVLKIKKGRQSFPASLLLYLADVPTATRQVIGLTERTWLKKMYQTINFLRKTLT